MPRLIFNPGRVDEKSFDLADGTTLIGRTSECGICIPHKSISRSHAQVECMSGRAEIIDLESKNGTFVSGVRVTRGELSAGDVLRLGDLTFSFVADDTARERPAASPPGAKDEARITDEELAAHGVVATLVHDLTSASLDDLLRESRTIEERDAAQHAEDRLRILLEASRLLASPREINALLNEILELVTQILRVDRAAILLVNLATGRLEPRTVKSTLPSSDAGAPYSQHIVDYVFSHHVAAIFSDAVTDPRLGAANSVIYQPIRASMGVPLRPKDTTIGVLYVDNLSAPDLFTEADLDFLAAFANQAAVAIENSTLYRRIEEETISRMQLIMDAKLASLSSVVAGIAHEIKNPLNFINNFASLSAGLTEELTASLRSSRGKLDPGSLADIDEALELLRGNVTKINDHGRRATNIINDMLRHARGGSRVREEGDINAIVAESLKLAYTGTPRGGGGLEIDVDASYDHSIGPMEMIRADLCRVFVNVIENACDAMLRKQRDLGAAYRPALTLRTEGHGDHVEICIRDNGTGIPLEIADRIYNPFFTTKPPGEGTGLGLSLSHDIIVQGHQGKIQANSVPGEFAEFIITIPRRPLAASKVP